LIAVLRIPTTAHSYCSNTELAGLSNSLRTEIKPSVKVWVAPVTLLQSQAYQLHRLSRCERNRATRMLTPAGTRNYRLRTSFILQLADKCFTESERDQLAMYRLEASQLRAFTRGWTRKEAIVKAIGIGLQAPLDSFDVSLKSKLPTTSKQLCSRPHLFLASKSDHLSPEYCQLYDLGHCLSCEVSLAVLHKAAAQTTQATQATVVRVIDVDAHLLNILAGVD